MSTFMDKCTNMGRQRRLLSVGLDSTVSRLPVTVRITEADPTGQLYFNQRIIRAVGDIAGFIKPNIAFYTGYDDDSGIRVYRRTMHMVRDEAPDVVRIADMKRGDIGDTNVGYVREAFDDFDADAVTVSPYFGLEAMKPFLDRGDRGIVVLCRTSNPGAADFQDRLTMLSPEEAKAWGYADGELPSETVIVYGQRRYMIPFYQVVAHRVVTEWNYNGNCGLVVGATAPGPMAAVRRIVGQRFMLLGHGLGKQQADLVATVANGVDRDGFGLAVNNSSQLTFAYEKSQTYGAEEFDLAAQEVALQNHADLRAALPLLGNDI